MNRYTDTGNTDDEYQYVGSFPISLPNVVWVVMSILLLAMYISTYKIKSKGFVGNVLRFALEYGKYKTFQVRIDIPKRCFSHYYYFASLWNSACFVTILGLYFGKFSYNWIADMFSLRLSHSTGDMLSIIIAITMLTVQSYRRLYESVFVSVYSSKGKINFIQYAWGMSFYSLLAPTLISECLPLNRLSFGQLELRHIFGIIGFIIASYFHHQSHAILADLRKTKNVKQDSHGIPQGGLFEYVSCPHYFAEILIYVSLLIVIGSQCVSWWLVVLYNVIVHISMAAGSHTWYKETFPSYPKNRKSLIPFVL